MKYLKYENTIMSIDESVDLLRNLLDNGDNGDSFVFEIVEMTEEELNDLPESMGF